MRAALVLALPLLASAAPLPVGSVTVAVSGLRSAKGEMLACLTARARSFPDCGKDPEARKLSVPAGETRLRFDRVAPGTYAVSLLHDENGNGKADMALFVPREGFGFSRNARVALGPPKFAAAAFAVEDRAVTVPIRMRYLF